MGIFLFGISLILWNCEKQENFTTQQKQTTLENIQSKFNPADFQKTIPYDFTVDWNNTNKLYSKELKTYYYEFHLIYNTTFNPTIINKKKKAGNYYISYKLLVTKDLDQGFSFYALKAYEKIAKTGNPITDVSFNNMNHFTGLIHLLNKNGTMAFAKKLSKGIKTTPSFYSKALQDANPYKQKMIEDCQTVIINHYKDWYRIWGDSDDLHIDYVRTEYLGFTTETVCGYSFLPDDPIDTGSGGSAAGEESGEGTYKSDCTPTTNSNYVAKITDPCAKKVEVELMQVVNQLDNPCAHAIFENLLAGIYKTNPLKPEVEILEDDINLSFSESILKLFENLKYTNYVIENGDLDLNKNASTRTSRGNIITTISNRYLSNATQLSIARSMIHEQVHGYILYENYNSLDFQNAIKEYAKNNGYNPDGSSEEKNRFHHEFMGQYVNAMAYSLYKWDKDYGTGGNLGWDYYKAMAFGGLFYNNNGVQVETDSFKELVPSQTERDNIKKIISNEEKGNNDSKSSKCN